MILCVILFSASASYSADSPGRDEKIISASSSTENPAEILCGVPIEDYPQAGRRILYFPPGRLYPPYTADPARIGFGLESVRVHTVGIADSSRDRVNLRAGAQLAFVRSQPLDHPDLGWEIALMGGFNDQNDVRHSLDNIGWDGHYGLIASVIPARTLGFKLGLEHVSSHLGDEYIQRTGRRRIGYTRQEVTAGVSWLWHEHWRLYAETGRALSMGNRELQRVWRTQFGLEYESAPILWKKRMSVYAAVDTQEMQERDWRADVSVQTGLVVRSDGRTWRFGVQWYKGRPPIREFFQDTERYSSFGLWIDI